MVVIVFAATVGSPDYPTVKGADVANLQPIAFTQTAATILAGQSSLQTYGPPYTNDTDNAQKVLGISPATWAGVRIPIDASKALVIDPLKRVAALVPDVATALEHLRVGDGRSAERMEQRVSRRIGRRDDRERSGAGGQR